MNAENVGHKDENVKPDPAESVRLRVVDAIDDFLVRNADRVAIKAAQRKLLRKRSRMRPDQFARWPQ